MNDIAYQSRDQILSIEYPKDGKYRARKVISRSKARPTGKYPSWKMGRMVHWESPHELNAYRLLDANPAVISFHEQPLVIRFILNGEEHLHYPDVLVELGETRELWEIKPECEALVPDVVARTRLLERELSHIGFTYRMVIGEDLSREPRLSNVLIVLKFGRAPISDLAREQFRQAILAADGISWGHVVNGEFGAYCRNIACRLILEGVLAVDLERPMTAGTILTWGNPALEKRKD